MRVMVLSVVSIIATTGIPANAQNSAGQVSATTAAISEKPICRQEEVTGSSIPETHCHTKTEWAALQKQHDAEIRSIRDSGHWSTNGH